VQVFSYSTHCVWYTAVLGCVVLIGYGMVAPQILERRIVRLTIQIQIIYTVYCKIPHDRQRKRRADLKTFQDYSRCGLTFTSLSEHDNLPTLMRDFIWSDSRSTAQNKPTVHGSAFGYYVQYGFLFYACYHRKIQCFTPKGQTDCMIETPTFCRHLSLSVSRQYGR
jgi:hypothetical protein